MAYEIELKAHLEESELDRVIDALLGIPGTKALGHVNKFDMYWSSTEDGDPVFRTRREMTADGPRVLFTAKPSKSRNEKGTEENQELEFEASDTQWDDVLTFCSGIGLQVCRLKWKKGTGYILDMDGYRIHVEILDVRFLGWFIEMEICPKSLEGFDFDAAEAALWHVLETVGVSSDAVEHRGYNRMLKAIGHDRG